jgi:hypothetical protein
MARFISRSSTISPGFDLPAFLAFSATALAASPAEAQEEPPGSALHFAATVYATNAAVALRADRACRGSHCFERYFSLVPVLGGFAQLSYGGIGFHDDHHGLLCVPLTLAAVGAQLGGLAAYAGGLGLDVASPAGGRFQLSLVPYYDEGTAAGLGFAWIQ